MRFGADGTRQTPDEDHGLRYGTLFVFGLRRHLYCRPLKHWCTWTCLDHPKLLAVVPLHEYVKACASGKRERARTIRVNRIGSWGSAGVDDHAIYADRGERADHRAISIEIDAFYNGFRLRHTADDVPSMCGE